MYRILLQSFSPQNQEKECWEIWNFAAEALMLFSQIVTSKGMLQTGAFIRLVYIYICLLHLE